MMVWTMLICAVAGFVLGTQCRLIPVAAASALIAAAVPVMALGSESAPVVETLTILSLIVVLQVFFLGGAAWRVLGPRTASHGEGFQMRPAAAPDAGAETRTMIN